MAMVGRTARHHPPSSDFLGAAEASRGSEPAEQQEGALAQRSTSATRYAEAVFQAAREEQSFDLWLRELGEVELVLTDPLAARVLTSPAIPQDRQLSILAAALPSLADPVRRFLDLLVRRGRLQLIPQIAERLRELVDQQRGLARVKVTTAVPLGSMERDLLASRLAARTGRRVELEEALDPDLIGGVLAQVGDEIIDGTIRARLERLRRALAGT
jgi:F-type H+-transporting ATPase subunit delta